MILKYECVLQLPDLLEFELVVDGVDSLKRLVVQFAELEPYELGTGKKKRVNIYRIVFRFSHR